MVAGSMEMHAKKIENYEMKTAEMHKSIYSVGKNNRNDINFFFCWKKLFINSIYFLNFIFFYMSSNLLIECKKNRVAATFIYQKKLI